MNFYVTWGFYSSLFFDLLTLTKEYVLCFVLDAFVRGFDDMADFAASCLLILVAGWEDLTEEGWELQLSM